MPKIARIDLLVKMMRGKSLNESFGETYGIPDSFFLLAANECITEIQKYLVLSQSEPFANYIDIVAAANQEGIDVPNDIFADNLVYDVMYAPNASAPFYTLDKAVSYRRDPNCRGSPAEWLTDAGKVWVQPFPYVSGGIYRFRYERKLDALDFRRGRVLSHTIVNGVLTALTIDPDSIIDDSDPLAMAEYLCLNSSRGDVDCRNIEVDGVDIDTGVVALSGTGFKLATTDTVIDGDFVCAGDDRTTHCKLAYIFEPFFVSWGQNEVNIEQSSTDTDETSPKLVQQLAAIAEIYASMPGGFNPIPQQRGS